MGIKLNGISVPIGGISWEYTESGQKGIQEMFYYLESKRLLINPKEMEKKEWSEKSAIEIKNKLVDILSRYKYDQNIITIIKQMVDACNEFLDNMQRVEVRGILYKNLQSDWEDLEYGVAMKKFRKIFRDRLYFNSCNLEHVLYNELKDFSDDEKEILSDEFAEKYEGKVLEFIDFISDKSVSVEGTYIWLMIVYV